MPNILFCINATIVFLSDEGRVFPLLCKLLPEYPTMRLLSEEGECIRVFGIVHGFQACHIELFVAYVSSLKTTSFQFSGFGLNASWAFAKAIRTFLFASVFFIFFCRIAFLYSKEWKAVVRVLSLYIARFGGRKNCMSDQEIV